MPEEGIYTQRNPIGLAGGNSIVYGYVYKTLVKIDPWGLRCKGWNNSLELSRPDNINIPKSVQRAFKKLFPEAKNGFNRAVEGLGNRN